MSNFNLKHPEKRMGEIFITNATTFVFRRRIGWKTKRMGAQAYTINGQPIAAMSGLYPVFITYEEALKDGLVRIKNILPGEILSLEDNKEKAAKILPIWENVLDNVARSQAVRKASRFNCG